MAPPFTKRRRPYSPNEFADSGKRVSERRLLHWLVGFVGCVGEKVFFFHSCTLSGRKRKDKWIFFMKFVCLHSVWRPERWRIGSYPPHSGQPNTEWEDDSDSSLLSVSYLSQKTYVSQPLNSSPRTHVTFEQRRVCLKFGNFLPVQHLRSLIHPTWPMSRGAKQWVVSFFSPSVSDIIAKQMLTEIERAHI